MMMPPIQTIKKTGTYLFPPPRTIRRNSITALTPLQTQKQAEELMLPLQIVKWNIKKTLPPLQTVNIPGRDPLPLQTELERTRRAATSTGDNMERRKDVKDSTDSEKKPPTDTLPQD